MPATGMGQTVGPSNANSATAAPSIIHSPFSGPTGSPFDAKSITGWNYSGASLGMPIYALQPTANVNGLPAAAMSTGAMSTGIGFGCNHVIGNPFGSRVGGNVTPDGSFGVPEFTDDYQPGISLPSNVSASVATMLAIGGGRSTITQGAAGNGYPTNEYFSAPNPYAVQPILEFGYGGSRDAGAGPAYTGFGTKTVTAIGSVANGAAIEAGWVNSTNKTLSTGQSAFGSATAASPAVT